MAFVRDKYGSLSSPSYGFIEESMRNQPYSKVVDQLRSVSEDVSEDTDINDDVAFGYLVRKGREQVFVQLSMVGPCSMMRRVKSDGSGEVLDGEKLTPFETEVWNQLSRAGICVLGPKVLTQVIPLNAINSEDGTSTVYNALFSDVEFSS